MRLRNLIRHVLSPDAEARGRLPVKKLLQNRLDIGNRQRRQHTVRRLRSELLRQPPDQFSVGIDQHPAGVLRRHNIRLHQAKRHIRPGNIRIHIGNHAISDRARQSQRTPDRNHRLPLHGQVGVSKGDNLHMILDAVA